MLLIPFSLCLAGSAESTSAILKELLGAGIMSNPAQWEPSPVGQDPPEQRGLEQAGGGNGADGHGEDPSGQTGRPKKAGHHHISRPRTQLPYKLSGQHEIPKELRISS